MDANVAAGAGLVFISYNSRDHETVLELCVRLRQHGHDLFVDRVDLTPGAPWFAEIESGLARARAVVVVIGPTGLGPIQKREMWLALDQQAKADAAGKTLPVIPILIGNAAIEDIPGFLLLNTFVNLSAGLAGAEFEKLLRALASDAPALIARESLACPYRGLNFFREEDAPNYVGRERATALLFEKLSHRSLVTVVGQSGSGKSSLVRAGLFPLLRRGRPPAQVWDILTLVPGRTPSSALIHAAVAQLLPAAPLSEQMQEGARLVELWRRGGDAIDDLFRRLAARLPDGGRLLVFVDQFEEVFTLAERGERERFIAALFALQASWPVTVVLTLRADFYGQALGHSGALCEAFQDGTVNLGPMGPEDLRRAIERPAAALGVQFEKGLVQRILEHLAAQPGSLPLLEFTLTRLWATRRGDLLTNADYDALGVPAAGARPSGPGLLGAVGAHAEQTYEGLLPTQREAAIRTFSRLVRISGAQEEGTDTRNRVLLSDLDVDERAAAEAFAKARLLVIGHDDALGQVVCEVAHEAIIRHWPRLVEFLHGHREFLLWRQTLATLEDVWARGERDSALLLRAGPLVEAQGWWKKRRGDLNVRERGFIEQSMEASRRPRVWLAATVVALLVAGGTLAAILRTDWYQVHAAVVAAKREVKTADPETAVMLGVALDALGRDEEAEAVLDAIQDDATRIPALIALADTRLDDGHAEGANRLLRAAKEHLSRNAEDAMDDPYGAFGSAFTSDLAEELARAGSLDEALALVPAEEHRERVLAAVAIGLARRPESCTDRSRLERIIDSISDPISMVHAHFDAADALNTAGCHPAARELTERGLKPARALFPGARRVALEKARDLFVALAEPQQAAALDKELASLQDGADAATTHHWLDQQLLRSNGAAVLAAVDAQLGQMQHPGDRAKALVEAADELATASNQDAARAVLEAARQSPGFQWDTPRQAALVWARMKATSEALASLRDQNGVFDELGLGDVVAELVRRVGVSALLEALAGSPPRERRKVCEEGGFSLLTANSVDDAESLAGTAESTRLWLAIARARLDRNQQERAIGALSATRELLARADRARYPIDDAWVLAVDLVAAGKEDDATKVVESIENTGQRLTALTRLAHVFIGRNQQDRALRLLNEVDGLTVDLSASPDVVKGTYRRLSMLAARLGLYRRARLFAEQCADSSERLTALNVLIIYASGSKSESLKKQLEEMANDTVDGDNRLKWGDP